MQIVLEGHEPPIPAQAGDTILLALLRAGLPFPFSCQTGNCGTCKCQLISGRIVELPHSAHVLPPHERAAGIILACRAQVRDDTAIRRIDLPE
jgi:ferredoxin